MFGGISSIWKQIILAAQASPLGDSVRYIEAGGYYDNVVRMTFDIPRDKIDYHPWNIFHRYENPKLTQIDEPFVFHSSYYRYSTNPQAINVTTVHDFTYEKFRRGLPLWIHSRQKRQAILHSKAIVCVSQNTRRDLLYFLGDYIDENSIHVIPNCIDPRFIHSQDDNTKIDGLGDCILFVGSRASYKNFRSLVKAMAPLRQYRLMICGSFLTENEKKFLDTTLGRDRYIYGGSLGVDKLAEVYRSVHSLVYPSAYEGFGMPIIEAQACRCPVIALDTSSIPEVIGDPRLMIPKIDTPNLEAALSMVDADRDKIIADGLENTRRFTPDKTVNAYISLYQNLLDKH